MTLEHTYCLKQRYLSIKSRIILVHEIWNSRIIHFYRPHLLGSSMLHRPGIVKPIKPAPPWCSHFFLGKTLKKTTNSWLVVEPTHLKNMSQKMGSSSPTIFETNINKIQRNPKPRHVTGDSEISLCQLILQKVDLATGIASVFRWMFHASSLGIRVDFHGIFPGFTGFTCSVGGYVLLHVENQIAGKFVVPKLFTIFTWLALGIGWSTCKKLCEDKASVDKQGNWNDRT